MVQQIESRLQPDPNVAFFIKAIQRGPSVSLRYQKLVRAANEQGPAQRSPDQFPLELEELPDLANIGPLAETISQRQQQWQEEEARKRKLELKQRNLVAGIAWTLQAANKEAIRLSPAAISQLKQVVREQGIPSAVWNETIESLSLLGSEQGKDYLMTEEEDGKRWRNGVATMVKWLLSNEAGLTLSALQSLVGPMRNERNPNRGNLMYAAIAYVRRVARGIVKDEEVQKLVEEWKEQNPDMEMFAFFRQAISNLPTSAAEEVPGEVKQDGEEAREIATGEGLTIEEGGNMQAKLALVAAFVLNNAPHICDSVPEWFNAILKNIENLGDGRQRSEEEIGRLREEMLRQLAANEGDGLDYLEDEIALGSDANATIRVLAGFCRLNFEYLAAFCQQRVEIAGELSKNGVVKNGAPIVPVDQERQEAARILNACFFPVAASIGDDPLEVIRQAIRKIVGVGEKVPPAIRLTELASLGITLGSNAARVVGIKRDAAKVPCHSAILALVAQELGIKAREENATQFVNLLSPLIEFEMQMHTKN